MRGDPLGDLAHITVVTEQLLDPFFKLEAMDADNIAKLDGKV